jgi:N-acetyl-gamma-glutamyl-phosphate reductase
MNKKITASIIGATGYTGLELIRLLIGHDDVELKYLTSISSTGKKINEIYPHLTGLCEITLTAENYDEIAENSSVVFLCLPHGQSQKAVKSLIGKTKIIDLAGDFRIQDIANWEKYYKSSHTAKDLVKDFTYGFPEYFSREISKSNNVANVGCFATTVQLALLPLKEKIKQVDILAVTGSTGSGKKPSLGTHHAVRAKNMTSYKIGTHQHLTEITQTLELTEQQINFVPTSGSFSRGIHLTAFVETNENISTDDVKKLFTEFYKSSFFVRMTEKVALTNVVGSNFVDISVENLNGKIIVQCGLDNLIKGASGTAIQNMNLMFGLKEDAGLKFFTPIYP